MGNFVKLCNDRWLNLDNVFMFELMDDLNSDGRADLRVHGIHGEPYQVLCFATRPEALSWLDGVV
jgi:hypothetical protein